MILKLKNINFTAIKVLFFLEDVDISKILGSLSISSGEKRCGCFIGYLYDDYEIKPLQIMLLCKGNAYLKSYDVQTRWMCFLIQDDELLKKHNISNKFSTDIKKEFDSEPVCNETIVKKKNKVF